MKYIRTKDGKITPYKKEYVVGDFRKPSERFYFVNNHDVITFYHKDFILKQADTIKELCDGFIITSKQGHIYDSYGDYSYELKEVLPQAREECPDEDWDLYGCVLVNGIIKQVAKLNDEKGELELL